MCWTVPSHHIHTKLCYLKRYSVCAIITCVYIQVGIILIEYDIVHGLYSFGFVVDVKGTVSEELPLIYLVC